MNDVSLNSIEQLSQRYGRVPSIEETGPAKGYNGRAMSKMALRSRLIWFILTLAGLTPLALSLFGLEVSPQLIAVGFGFLVPGGGFIACGGVLTMAFGLFVTFYLWKKKGQQLQTKYGTEAGILGFWLLGALGGLLAHPALAGYLILTTRFERPFWGWLLAVASACWLWGGYERRIKQSFKLIGEARSERIGFFDEAMEELQKAVDSYDAAGDAEPELDEEQLSLMRCMLDATVREPGDFSCFDPSAGRSSYRYQFSSAGFALLLMQAKYTPNFHGYLAQAQRFIIDALTDPRTCGYWKKANLLGYLKWDPDPVKKSNSHMSCWMAPVMTGYGALTGDRQYEEDSALKFRPYEKDPEKSCDYNVKGIVERLHAQFQNSKHPYMLIPCEPNLVYTVCNSYGILGMMIYDRDHDTHYCEDFADNLYKAVTENFVEADGSFALCRQYLYGLRFLPELQMMYDPLLDVQNYMMYAPIFPGLCKRNYSMARKQALEIRDGVTFIRGRKWEELFDLTSMTMSPALTLSYLEMTAAEYGDSEILSGLRKAEDMHLRRLDERPYLKYEGVSMVAMANFAFSRLLRKDFWTDVILRGPEKTAFTGPILSECKFPDVLVAKAVSHGSDLELVLYNGAGAGEQKISVERLAAGKEYIEKNTGMIFRADEHGKAELGVSLNGRTCVHIEKQIS